mgnify:FL=1
MEKQSKNVEKTNQSKQKQTAAQDVLTQEENGVTVVAEIGTDDLKKTLSDITSDEKHDVSDKNIANEQDPSEHTSDSEEKDPKNGKKKLTLETLFERGKAKGSITNAELMEALEDVDYDLEQIEKLYETFENMGIEVTGYLEASEMNKIEDEVEQYESAEEMEKMLAQEGLAIDDPVRMYLKEIGKVPLLDAESEKNIAQKIAAGEEALEEVRQKITEQSTEKISDEEMQRICSSIAKQGKSDVYTPDPETAKIIQVGQHAKEQLVECNLRLVVSIAKRYVGKGMFFLDLIQEGNLGLMKAVEKYDYKKGYKFSTYATWWIRQAITRAIADQARTIRIPVHMVETIHKVSRVSRQLLQELGHEASAEEIANVMDISPDKVREIMKIAQEPVSLETPIGEEEDSHLGDFIPDDDSPAPADAASYQLLREQLCEVLHTLTPREEQVLKLRFGLKDGRTRTLEEVGKEFNITRERIRQIEAKALRKLRHPSRSKRLKDYLE